jgi:hypothetical protein
MKNSNCRRLPKQELRNLPADRCPQVSPASSPGCGNGSGQAAIIWLAIDFELD